MNESPRRDQISHNTHIRLETISRNNLSKQDKHIKSTYNISLIVNSPNVPHSKSLQPTRKESFSPTSSLCDAHQTRTNHDAWHNRQDTDLSVETLPCTFHLRGEVTSLMRIPSRASIISSTRIFCASRWKSDSYTSQLPEALR